MTNYNNKRARPLEAWCECSHCSRRADGGLFVSVTTWNRHNKHTSLKIDNAKRRRRTDVDDMELGGKLSQFRSKQYYTTSYVYTYIYSIVIIFRRK